MNEGMRTLSSRYLILANSVIFILQRLNREPNSTVPSFTVLRNYTLLSYCLKLVYSWNLATKGQNTNNLCRGVQVQLKKNKTEAGREQYKRLIIKVISGLVRKLCRIPWQNNLEKIAVYEKVKCIALLQSCVELGSPDTHKTSLLCYVSIAYNPCSKEAILSIMWKLSKMRKEDMVGLC